VGEFNPRSTVRRVLEEHSNGRRLLWEHGYDIGEGFVDVLSQHQSLLEAARNGRLRDIEGLLDTLNRGRPWRPE
jgi:hypothetical protein